MLHTELSMNTFLYPKDPLPFTDKGDKNNIALDCGWGKLIFAHTYKSVKQMVSELEKESTDKRNIAFYVNEPHVILAESPQTLFLDPSHTYRIDLDAQLVERRTDKKRQFNIRRIKTRKDATEINRLYSNCDMVTVPNEYFLNHRTSDVIYHYIAEDNETGEIIGTVTGIDHVASFEDQTNGSSLWCLAVDHQSHHPGIGTALVQVLIRLFKRKKRSYMDLSVIHDNESAIELYKKIGFEKIPAFAIKHKNPFNEPLFIGSENCSELNIYAQIITKEAKRRGISVEVLDASEGLFELTCGGRSIHCHESLTELTTSIAFMRCQNKSITRAIFKKNGFSVPDQILYTSYKEACFFLDTVKSCVVKPLDSEQGSGISVDITDKEELKDAIHSAQKVSEKIIIENYCSGKDLRIIVIGGEVVAAAVRKPPRIYGDGVSNIRQLIEKQSRRRQAATGGESIIPLDEETERTIGVFGYSLDSILEQGKKLVVRKLANLHTGGTIHDVTDQLHPKLVDVAINAAAAIDIPVVGLDMIIDSPDKPLYTLIEANERPGLANHEPQPTAEKFIDFLFPQTKLS